MTTSPRATGVSPRASRRGGRDGSTWPMSPLRLRNSCAHVWLLAPGRADTLSLAPIRMTRHPGALVAVALRLALATTAYVQLGTRLAAVQSDEHSRIAVKAPVDSLLERLVGQWTMRGSIRGRAAMYHVS